MKTAVVSGTSYGLGEAIATVLLEKDFKIYGISRSEPKVKDDNFVWIKADLLEDKSFDLIKKKILEDKIDLLINNAGVVYAQKALEFTDDTFHKTFGVNLLAPIKLTSILKSKLENGMVVNISSTSDRFVEERLGMYCAAKSALDIYFDAVAIENKQIKIINILPVYIDTPMLDGISKILNFSTNGATDPKKLAIAIENVISSGQNLESGSRVMMLSKGNMDEIEDLEKLYYYNIDTKEFKKLK